MSDFLNIYVGIYVLAAALIYAATVWSRRRYRRQLQAARDAAFRVGERPAERAEELLLGPGQRLQELQRAAVSDALILGAVILVLPGIVYWLAGADRDGFALAFAGLAIWVLVSATDAGKAFFGGLLFRFLLASRAPFQVGDRVTLAGYSGKVLDVGLFHVRLQTADDDLVSLPTASLWSEPLVSANAGDSASLAVITVYLSPRIEPAQLQAAEDALWAAIGASLYWDPTKSRQIFIGQSVEAITLTGKAYVASTYNEALFKSDVLKTFLMTAREQNLPLAEKL